MKKLLLGICTLLFISVISFAQDGKKDFKDAKKEYGSFKLNEMENQDKLTAAVEAIEKAITGSETSGSMDTWMVRGDIYSSIASQIINIRTLEFGDPGKLPKVDIPGVKAMESYMKALELADPKKKGPIKKVMQSMQAVQGSLSNLGIYAYEEQAYDKAYQCFDGVLQIHSKLKEANEESSLDAEENYNYQIYLTGLAAMNNNNTAKAKEHFQFLYEKEYDQATIYDALYKVTADEDIEKAYQYLEKGRQKYPDDVTILFAEINHFLKLNQLDELINKLKIAIEKEPNNISLYNTLGSVYDQLYQKEYAAGTDKAQEYFNNAKEYYEKALEMNSDSFDAYYSIGALFYNKAAIVAKEVNEIVDNKEYEKKRLELMSLFDQALPYFKDAEKRDPNDVNTLIALKEIFAKKDDFETSNIFKTRLENVQAGNKNDDSYFKK